jgi:hypothetical protein
VNGPVPVAGWVTVMTSKAESPQSASSVNGTLAGLISSGQPVLDATTTVPEAPGVTAERPDVSVDGGPLVK